MRARAAPHRALAPAVRARPAPARAARSRRVSVRARGRASSTSSSRDHPTRARREHRARGRPAGSPPRRRGSRAPPCAARARARRASHSCISARVIASSAPNGSSRHSTGLPDSSVRTNATRWRMPPESSCGRACSKPSRPSSTNSAPRARARPRARHTRDAQRQRRVVERAQPRQQQVALGHQHRRRALDRARLRGSAGRTSAPAASSCRSRSGRPPPAARRDRRAARRPSSACTRAPRRSRYAQLTSVAGRHRPASPARRTAASGWTADRSARRSLRGHYPTGSKGRRRGNRVPVRHLSRPSRQLPWCLLC